MLTQLELFAGIGGFGLAGEWAGIETVCQVEIDPFCQLHACCLVRRYYFKSLCRQVCRKIHPKRHKIAHKETPKRGLKRQKATICDNLRKGVNPVGITAAARIALKSNVVRALPLKMCLGLC